MTTSTTRTTTTKTQAINSPGPGPVIAWITNHPGLYLTTCLVIGSLIRAQMAHWDAGTFLDPLFPVIHH
jgi:hypothetical protein